jgi:hypothetical protein
VLGGSTDLVRQAPGVFSGDLSGIAAAEVPWWARPRYFPPRRLALIADWQQKMEALAPLSVTEDIRALSGTPSWVRTSADISASVNMYSGSDCCR